MSRQAKGIRLWLRRERRRDGKIIRQAKWFILDGEKQVSTGCGRDDRAGAEKALSDYLAQRYEPGTGQRDPDLLEVNDILTIYGREKAVLAKAPERIGYAIEVLARFWAGKTVGQVKGKTCRDYVTWRTAQRWTQAKNRSDLMVSVGTARRELEVVQSAINYYHEEYGLKVVPVVTFPEKPEPKSDWLTRRDAALALRAMRRNKWLRHLIRFALIGIYTGTRHSAALALQWTPSETSGYVDLEAGILYRKGRAERASKKRQPRSRIPPRLLFWLRRWKAEDDLANAKRLAEGKPVCTKIIHRYGKPILKIRRSWKTMCREAGLTPSTPHCMRHTAATWLMQRGADLWHAADYLGMDPRTLIEVYGHHHPDHQAEVISKFSAQR